MKKYLFLVSVAALTFSSCSDQSTEFVGDSVAKQAREISFSPVARPTTRTAADTYQYAIDGPTFPTDLNMYVAAYQVAPTATNYFAGTQFTYSGSSNIWNGATKRYWPLSPAYINFLAYANVTGTANFNATNYASGAVISQSDNSSAQTDLMYAIGNGAVTKSGNDLTFPAANVPMEFKHAQGWIDFYVKAYSDVETAITVNSITLKGAKYAGTYTITHTNYNADSDQEVSGAWSGLAAAKDAAVPGWNATALTTSLVEVSHGLMVCPDDDDATNDWTSFVINYTVDSKTYDFEYLAPAAPGANVDQAKHYVYNITFKLHEILVAATVADWTDVTATNVTVDE
ncbi:MAG: fimbrillin family protein [Bacteroidaceae bacterium]|nr:fimbrillin family protein [Bacteroidaceae bacterium]